MFITRFITPTKDIIFFNQHTKLLIDVGNRHTGIHSLPSKNFIPSWDYCAYNVFFSTADRQSTMLGVRGPTLESLGSNSLLSELKQRWQHGFFTIGPTCYDSLVRASVGIRSCQFWNCAGYQRRLPVFVQSYSVL